MQNGIQERLVDVNLAIVTDETQVSKLVHEKADASHTKLESTVRYLGIEVDDALNMAEQINL